MKTEKSVMVFNGEIYNHKKLRRLLQSQDVQFLGDSDTEVLLRGIEKIGWNFLEEVEGCWAFVLYEPTSGRLYFSRDPLGEKQLLYKINSSGLILASEAKAILSTQRESDLDSNRLFSDLIFDFFSNRECTYFNKIKNSRPGSVYSYDTLGNLQEVYVCKVGDRNTDTSLRRLLAHAVSSMIPEHHVCAVVLSGGLDSSIIASLLKTEARNMPFIAVTAAYEKGNNDDLGFAKHLVRELGGIDHQQIIIDSTAAEQNFLSVQTALEEPLHDQVYITQYLIYQHLSSLGIRVALSGQGADEFWGGYYYHYSLQNLYSADIDTTINHFLKQANDRGLYHLLTHIELYKLIEDNIASRWAKTNPLQNMLMEGHLQAMISHEDKLSMASAVEVRLPFLNLALVKHALNLSDEEKIYLGVEKSPLRYAMRGILTERLRLRRKQAFPDMPKSAYINTNFLSDLSSNSKFFSRIEIEKVSGKSPALEWRMNAINAFSGVFSGDNASGNHL